MPKPLFGVYVHWPFCASKCPYCDFNSHVSESIDHEAWAQAYLSELDYYAEKTQGRQVTSIFFGGGTPSLMKPETVEAVIARIQKNWSVANDIEITLEANPTSVETDKFQDFKLAGVNRVSVGLQALNDRDLQFLGRQHSVAEGVAAVNTAASVFDQYSFDLIYARPEQTVSEWEAELRQALEHTGGHLSLYQLTIEQGTPFYARHQRGEFSVPEADQAGEFYEVTQNILEEAGMPSYEISNHARAGQESVHNMTYWRYEDYAGIGPGAHGRLSLNGDKYATRGKRAPDVWMESVRQRGHGSHPFETVEHEQRAVECLMMGLRLAGGVHIPKLEEEAGRPLDKVLSQDKLEAMIREGYLVRDAEYLAATVAGRQRLNSLLGYLL